MITLLIGKPGSGKSYHATREILRILAQDVKRGSKRKIYTNLSLVIEEVNIYLSAELGTDVDVSDRVVVLPDEFFVFDKSAVTSSDFQTLKQGLKRTQVIRDDSLGYWWNRFDNDAVIVIDEIQRYLGGQTKGDKSVINSIAVYFSTHRHRRHEVILISQSLTNIPLEVRKYAETVLEVFNAKSLSLPFPLSVSGRDIEILMKAFGVQRQVYRVKRGLLDLARPHVVDFEREPEVVATSPAIYACYKSHTLAKEEEGAFISDTELPFELGPGQKWRAVKWFIGRYWAPVFFKVSIVVIAVFMVRSFFHTVFSMDFNNIAPQIATDDKKDTKPKSTAKIVKSDKTVSPIKQIPVEAVPSPPLGIQFAPDFIVVDGQQYNIGDYLPFKGRFLRSVDVRRREIETDDPYKKYLSDLYFVDYMDRLSKLSYCEACGR